jgi:hypothetical protein
MAAGRVSHHQLSRRPRPSAGPLRVPVASAPMRSAPPPRAGAVPPRWPYVRRTPWPRSLYDRAAPCAAAAPLPRVRPGAVRALLRRRTAASRVHRSSSAAVPPCAGVAPCSPAAAPPGCAVLASAQVEVDAFAGSARSGWSAHRRDAAPAGEIVGSLSAPPRGPGRSAAQPPVARRRECRRPLRAAPGVVPHLLGRRALWRWRRGAGTSTMHAAPTPRSHAASRQARRACPGPVPGRPPRSAASGRAAPRLSGRAGAGRAWSGRCPRRRGSLRCERFRALVDVGKDLIPARRARSRLLPW